MALEMTKILFLKDELMKAVLKAILQRCCWGKEKPRDFPLIRKYSFLTLLASPGGEFVHLESIAGLSASERLPCAAEIAELPPEQPPTTCMDPKHLRSGGGE